jgi:uncharacterized repeat protein (TIGR03803 family)
MTRTGQHHRRVSALVLGAMFVTAVIGTRAAQAQTYTVLHRFKGSPTDGAQPVSGLIRDSAGNLYGTTSVGGPSTGATNAGVVFKLDKTGETVLHSFTGGADGASPTAGVIQDSAGNLYGTTRYGGSSSRCSYGCGVVFKLDTTGTETVLYSFTGGADGDAPNAGVIRDSAGNFHGTTYTGGIVTHSCSSGCGVVFKLDTTGTETVVHRFGGPTDGANPTAGLIGDSAGNLYGTTYNGGASGAGVVFKLDTTGTATVLYNFTGKADGGNPSGVIRDSAGNLYGTTSAGGIVNQTCTFGCGVVFKLDTTGTETAPRRSNPRPGWQPLRHYLRRRRIGMWAQRLRGCVQAGTLTPRKASA